MIFNITTDAKAYTDLTGRLHHQSSRGHNYILVAYNHDGNNILAEPMKKREADTIIDAWNKLCSRLYNNGIVTTNYILDNECSTAFKIDFHEANVTIKLVPPNQHRSNAAERAIMTFKKQLLSGLATYHKDFPLREWDRLLHQVEMIFNLLRNSRLNPKLSAWAYVFVKNKFNKCQLLPPGTKIIIHTKPGERMKWTFHSDQCS